MGLLIRHHRHLRSFRKCSTVSLVPGHLYVLRVLLGCGTSGSAGRMSIDAARLPPSVPLCFGKLIRRADRSHSRRERRGNVARPERPALCSIDRRPCRAGGPPTRTRSRCAVGGAALRSLPSRRWNPISRSSALSARSRGAAASTRLRSVTSTASPIPVAASIIASTASGPANTSRACSPPCASAAPRPSVKLLPGAVHASRSSWIVAALQRRH